VIYPGEAGVATVSFTCVGGDLLLEEVTFPILCGDDADCSILF